MMASKKASGTMAGRTSGAISMKMLFRGITMTQNLVRSPKLCRAGMALVMGMPHGAKKKALVNIRMATVGMAKMMRSLSLSLPLHLGLFLSPSLSPFPLFLLLL